MRLQGGVVQALSIFSIRHLLKGFLNFKHIFEAETYGSKFVAAHNDVDCIVDLHHILQMLVKFSIVPSWVSGDKRCVSNNSIIPSKKHQKRKNILSYYHFQESQVAEINDFLHIEGKHNPDDIGKKHTTFSQWYEVTKS